MLVNPPEDGLPVWFDAAMSALDDHDDADQDGPSEMVVDRDGFCPVMDGSGRREK
jgi:hypothetical protein